MDALCPACDLGLLTACTCGPRVLSISSGVRNRLSEYAASGDLPKSVTTLLRELVAAWDAGEPR